MACDEKPKNASRGVPSHSHLSLGTALPFGTVTDNRVYHQKIESTYNRGKQLKAYEELFDSLTDDRIKNKKRIIKLAGKYKFIDEFAFIDTNSTTAKELAIKEMQLLIDALRQTARYEGKKDDLTTFKGVKMKGADLGAFAQEILNNHEIEFATRQIELLEEKKSQLTNSAEISQYNQKIKALRSSIRAFKADLKNHQKSASIHEEEVLPE